MKRVIIAAFALAVASVATAKDVRFSITGYFMRYLGGDRFEFYAVNANGEKVYSRTDGYNVAERGNADGYFSTMELPPSVRRRWAVTNGVLFVRYFDCKKQKDRYTQELKCEDYQHGVRYTLYAGSTNLWLWATEPFPTSGFCVTIK